MKYFVYFVLLLPVFGHCQTTDDIERAISKTQKQIESLGRWDADSALPAIQGDLYDYLLMTLPKVRNSLSYNYKFEQGLVRCTTSTDRKLRFWTFDESVAEAGVYSTLAEFETSSGVKMKDVSDSEKEGDVGVGGWCDTIYSITGSDGVTYYLPLMHFVADRDIVGMGIEAYAIEGGRLRSKIKLFRTPKKELTTISFFYSYGNSNDRDTGRIPQIRLGRDGKSLFIPLVKDTRITDDNLRYEFDGKQFVYKGVEK